MADEATKKTSTKEKAPRTTEKTEAGEEGRRLTKLLDRALHDCVEGLGEMADATAADCTALRPLALTLAKVYKPCALQVQKTELMAGGGDTYTHGQSAVEEKRSGCGLARTSFISAGIL